MKVGDTVCVKGQGTDALLHVHTTIVRVTKTLVVTTSGRRFRIEKSGPYRSVPYQPYGGTSASLICQKEKD